MAGQIFPAGSFVLSSKKLTPDRSKSVNSRRFPSCTLASHRSDLSRRWDIPLPLTYPSSNAGSCELFSLAQSGTLAIYSKQHRLSWHWCVGHHFSWGKQTDFLSIGLISVLQPIWTSHQVERAFHCWKSSRIAKGAALC